MQVNLTFDTEKDSVEEFRKLLNYIEQIIADKEGIKQPEQRAQTSSNVPKPQAPTKTTGGCRVVPYQDLSDALFSLCSKKRI